MNLISNSSHKWRLRFFQMACDISVWSKDPEKRVGALVVSPDGRKVSWGFNGFPPGIADDDRIKVKALKRELSVHAEVNAIMNASFPTEGAVLFCTHPPCTPCALQIITARIHTVISPRSSPTSNWAASCDGALRLMAEAGVRHLDVNELEEDHT